MTEWKTVDSSQQAATLELAGSGDPKRIRLGAKTAIGSAADCDIVVAGAGSAARLARIERVGGAHRVIAEPGIAVALRGERIAEAMLHDGDELSIGDALLIYRNPLASRIAAVHSYATPPGASLITIGRADTDIVLSQPLVSRRHADLRWERDRHVLYDRASANGTWVNGVRVTSAGRPLAPGDVVQIGTFRLTYDGDSLDSFDQRGAVRLDATGVARSVGDRVLLAPTTLSIEPCEFVAIVGGSGAGKSTLMMALCGFTRATGGTVMLNGDDLYTSFEAYRSIIGYVPQDDILHRALVVRRALEYAARLRLPSDTTDDEITRRIDSVLASVDMTDHADKRIEQLSGGQRKRVSIACELLADPVLLFLDEPTSGLDPGLERTLMQTLRKLADSGRTIVLITHATVNIRLCHHVAFLARGQLTYFGPPTQALEFFAVSEFADIYNAIDHDPQGWATRYASSLQHQKYVIERPGRAPRAPSVNERAAKLQQARRQRLSRKRQLGLLCRRYLEVLFADRKNLALLLLQAPVIGVLLVLVSSPSSLTSSRIEAKKLMFMLATTGVWFGVINAAREICKETNVLRRERLAGLRAGPYVGSKVVVLFGLVVVQSLLLIGVVALRVTLPRGGILLPAPLELFVTVALAGGAGIALGLCVSALASTPDKATSLIPIVVVPQVLFAGIMFALAGVTHVLSYAVSARAAVEALGATIDVNQLAAPAMMAGEPQYSHQPATLVTAWSWLAAQAAVFAACAWLAVRRRY